MPAVQPVPRPTKVDRFVADELLMARHAASDAAASTTSGDLVNPLRPARLLDAAASIGASTAHVDAARGALLLGKSTRFDAVPIRIHLDKAAALLHDAVDRTGPAYGPLVKRVNQHLVAAVELLDPLLAARGITDLAPVR